MKKIITTVGTSLFTNYNEEKNETLNKDIKDEPYSEYASWEDDISDIKEKLLLFAKKENSCAELTSIMKLQEKYEDIEVYLIATDTIESVVVCEILKEVLDNVKFNPQYDVIDKLQIEKYKDFKEGLSNLINRLYGIASNYYDNLILNITGGYKAVIPYLTIFGQVNSVPLYYVFENSDSLISIPKIPLSIDEALFDKYWKEFEQLSKEEVVEKSSLDYNFLREMESLFEVDDGLVALNPLGTILWRRYREKFFILYAPKEVLEEIAKQSDIQRILETKFWQETRESKTERKDGHLVYDDGKNVNRIFYFSDDEVIYVYKTFDSGHDEYEKYINNSSVNKEEIKENSLTKKIEKRIDNV
jgi:putative CRISPR-associated protein (TIGR02619 family)